MTAATPYQLCVRCIMDTTDPEISFDEEGVCSHCHYFDTVMAPRWHPNEQGKGMLDEIAAKIREEGKNQEYDSILGLSGGVDSSYLACVVKDLGLNPLVVHVDAGWNSELAVRNIERVVNTLGFDLFTHVINWEEMRDLQLAFLHAATANQDVPQDHAFFGALTRFAIEHNLRFILSGDNIATESILPSAWGYSAMDLRHLMSIHRRFGQGKLREFPRVGFFLYRIYFPFVRRFETISPLNYMPYVKQDAIAYLQERLDWRPYGDKHCESRFTRFFQGHYLPTKFGYDKRRAHLASLVLSGQCTRAEALETMATPPYEDDALADDKAFVLKKLGLSESQWQELMALPNRTYRDYPNNERWILAGRRMLTTVRAKLNRS